MEDKLKQIESKKELFTEIAVTTGREFGTIKNHWFNPCNVPEKFLEVVNKIIDKRLDYQKASKTLHEKYFGN